MLDAYSDAGGWGGSSLPVPYGGGGGLSPYTQSSFWPTLGRLGMSVGSNLLADYLYGQGQGGTGIPEVQGPPQLPAVPAPPTIDAGPLGPLPAPSLGIFRPVPTHLVPRNRLEIRGPDGRMYYYLRAVPRGWKVMSRHVQGIRSCRSRRPR